MKAIRDTLSLILVTALPVLWAGCDPDPGNSAPSMVDGGTYALVVATDYEAGAYSLVDLADLSISESIQAIHEDSVCRFDVETSIPFIVGRYGSDAVAVIDPHAGWTVSSEYSVGAGSNPQDIAVASSERAFVARLGHPELLIVHPTDGTEIGTVDLISLADADGNPDAAWILHLQGRIYVALQKLDNFVPTGPSSIVVIDAATGTIEEEIILGGANNYGKLRYNHVLDKIVIAQAGVFGDLDGGIEYLDPHDLTLSGFVITEQEIGGDLSDVVIVSETKGYAVIGVPVDSGAATHLVSFNPSTGKKLDDLIVRDDWTIGFMELTPDGGQLWVCDREPELPGLRIFDTGNDTEITGVPLDVGLPPFMICFVHQNKEGVQQ